MSYNGSLKILLLILFFFLPKILVAESQMKIACMSSWYEHCHMGTCKDNLNKEPFLKQVKIFIDIKAKTLIRRTDNDYIMKIQETQLRSKNHIYIGYEDNWSNGFIVINLINEEEGTTSYVDTLFTSVGGFISTGFCKLQIIQ